MKANKLVLHKVNINAIGTFFFIGG